MKNKYPQQPIGLTISDGHISAVRYLMSKEKSKRNGTKQHDELLYPKGLLNRLFTNKQRLSCYDTIWPSHTCEMCRWMWECIRYHEDIQDDR